MTTITMKISRLRSSCLCNNNANNIHSNRLIVIDQSQVLFIRIELNVRASADTETRNKSCFKTRARKLSSSLDSLFVISNSLFAIGYRFLFGYWLLVICICTRQFLRPLKRD